MLARVNRELGVTVIMSTHTPEDVRLTRRAPSPWGGRRCGDARAGGSRASPALEKPEVATAPRAHGMREERANCVRVREAMFRYEKNCRGFCAASTCRFAAAAFTRSSAATDPQDHVAQAHSEGEVSAAWQSGQRPDRRAGAPSAGSQDAVRVRQRGGGACRVARAVRLHARRRARDAGEIGLEGCEKRHPYDLSGGQQQSSRSRSCFCASPSFCFSTSRRKVSTPRRARDVSLIVRDLAAKAHRRVRDARPRFRDDHRRRGVHALRRRDGVHGGSPRVFRQQPGVSTQRLLASVRRVAAKAGGGSA